MPFSYLNSSIAQTAVAVLVFAVGQVPVVEQVLAAVLLTVVVLLTAVVLLIAVDKVVAALAVTIVI